MRHRVRLEINTPIALGRGVTVVRRLEESLGGERGDRLPVPVRVVEPLQHFVEFRVIGCTLLFAWLRMMFHAL